MLLVEVGGVRVVPFSSKNLSLRVLFTASSETTGGIGRCGLRAGFCGRLGALIRMVLRGDRALLRPDVDNRDVLMIIVRVCGK